MAEQEYLRPQAPLEIDGKYIYPLTTYNQIIMPDNTRWDGKIAADQEPNYNLLDNSNFEIAQAGYNGMHGTQQYAADRWISSSNGNLTVTGEMKTYTSNKGYCFMLQKLWNDGRDRGKTYTLVLTLSDGTRVACCGTSPDSDTTEDFKIAEATFGNGGAILIRKLAENNNPNGQLQIRIAATKAGASVSFLNVDLFEGAYTAETAPPHIPKGYAAELLACQRYFFTFNNYGNYSVPIGNGYMANTNTARLLIRLPVPMRTTPTFGSLSVPASGIELRAANSLFQNVTITVLGNTKNGILLHCILPSGKTTTSHATCTLTFAGEGTGVSYLYFSADL